MAFEDAIVVPILGASRIQPMGGMRSIPSGV
jgi:hypothetical protein